MTYFSNKKIIMLIEFKNQFKDIFEEYLNKNRTLEDTLQKLKLFQSAWSTARVDVKNYGSKDNSVNFLKNDKKVMFPNWFKDKKGIGSSVLFDKSGFISFKPVNNGSLVVKFMGMDFRNNIDERIPVYINYTTVRINDLIISENEFVWHNTPFVYKNHCKNNESITVNVEFNTIFDYFPQLYFYLYDIRTSTDLLLAKEKIIKFIKIQKQMIK